MTLKELLKPLKKIWKDIRYNSIKKDVNELVRKVL